MMLICISNLHFWERRKTMKSVKTVINWITYITSALLILGFVFTMVIKPDLGVKIMEKTTSLSAKLNPDEWVYGNEKDLETQMKNGVLFANVDEPSESKIFVPALIIALLILIGLAALIMSGFEDGTAEGIAFVVLLLPPAIGVLSSLFGTTMILGILVVGIIIGVGGVLSER